MATPTRFALPTYTPAQLLKFYARIQLPQSIINHITSPTFEPDLSTLATLQLCTVSSIPFECLSLHYSPSPKITISPDFLFQKIVDKGDGREGNGRGGYCMENNTLFGTVLRSIGYAAYPVGCRVNSDTNEKEGEEAVYYPWSHMVTIVPLHGTRYLIDIGFGASGPHQPLPLLLSSSSPIPNVGPSQIRLLRAPLPDCLDQTQNHWIVQHRYNADSRWITAYATPAVEFLPQDFDLMNVGTSTGEGLFTGNVICMVMLREEGKLVGDLTLFNWDLKERRGGVSRLVEHFENEEERVRGIEKYFGIRFSGEETADMFRKEREAKSKALEK